MAHRKRRERIDRGIKARAEDVFALNSWREMLYLAAPRLLPVVACLVLPLVLGAYWQKVLLSVAVFALLAISWDLLAQTGMVSLGQALFFGMGAYVTGILDHYGNLPPLVTIPAATVFGSLICTILLLPVLRLRGIYFSMVTLILPLMLVRLIEATRLFGGTEGLSGMQPLRHAAAAVGVGGAVWGAGRFAGGPVRFSAHAELRLRPGSEGHSGQRPLGDQRRHQHLRV